MGLSKRTFLCSVGAAGISAACARFPSIVKTPPKVVVIGAGAGGSVVARHIKRSMPFAHVTLIEQALHYDTCFMSNEVLGGERKLQTLRYGFSNLSAQGIRVFQALATHIDLDKQVVVTEDGTRHDYTRLVISPGISFKPLEGYGEEAHLAMPHAWKAGAQTKLLRDQLRAMDDGGVVIVASPNAPFRCPPGPYERVSQIAYYLRENKPKSKILLIDGQEEFTKQRLFLQGWEREYPGMIEWLPASENGGGVVAVDVDSMTVFTEIDEFHGDVINVIPPQRAANLAIEAGLTDISEWCPVYANTFESQLVRGVHIIGDASIAHAMAKSASSANSQAKVCAAAVVAALKEAPPPTPSYLDACYSIIAPRYGISVASVYRYSKDDNRIKKVSSGMTSLDASTDTLRRETQYAYSWYRNITQDMYGR